MALNALKVIAEFGAPWYGKVKNVAAVKLAGDIILAATGIVALLTKDAASAEDNVPAILGGVVLRYATLSTDTGGIGDKMYWDNTNSRFTTTSTSNTYAGRLAKAKASGETTADIYLNLQPA